MLCNNKRANHNPDEKKLQRKTKVQRRKRNREKEATTSDLGTERERERERVAVRDVQQGGIIDTTKQRCFLFIIFSFC